MCMTAELILQSKQAVTIAKMGLRVYIAANVFPHSGRQIDFERKKNGMAEKHSHIKSFICCPSS